MDKKMNKNSKTSTNYIKRFYEWYKKRKLAKKIEREIYLKKQMECEKEIERMEKELVNTKKEIEKIEHELINAKKEHGGYKVENRVENKSNSRHFLTKKIGSSIPIFIIVIIFVIIIIIITNPDSTSRSGTNYTNNNSNTSSNTLNSTSNLHTGTYAYINVNSGITYCAYDLKTLDKVLDYVINNAPVEKFQELALYNKLTVFKNGERVFIEEREFLKRFVRGNDATGYYTGCWVLKEHLRSE